MSDPIAATNDLRSVALEEINAIRAAFSAACEMVRSSSDVLPNLLTLDSRELYRGVSLLKVMECAPNLGKTGARSVLSSAGLSFRTTFDEITPEMFARLQRAIAEQGSGN